LRLRLAVVLMALLAASVVAAPTLRVGAATPRVPVILDTDIYSGGDDIGAVATLFAFDLRGQDNVIAMGVDTRYNRPAVSANSWKCVAAIAQFYGYPNMPIGSDMPDNGPPAPSSDDFINPCAALASPNTPAPGSAVEVYRKALVSQADDSVVIVCTGYEENIDNLLKSSPDSISPLSGRALVAEKVKELVMMGGGYPSRDGENNFEGDAGAASDVATNWPTKIVYSGYEVGDEVFTGETVTKTHPSDSPVRVALEAFAGPNEAIASYDLTAAYHAIDPSDPNLSEVGPGTNAIDEYGDNTFTLGTGDEYYLTLGNVTELEASLESLWDTLPGTASQGLSFTTSPPSPATLGGTYDVATSGGASGNPVTLTIDASSTSGCTINGSDQVAFSLPTGSCIIDANEPGSTTYAPEALQQTIQVAKIAQTISFTSTPPSAAKIGGTYTVAATGGGSSSPVVFSIDASSTSGCTLGSSGKVTFAAPLGSCVVDANQAGTSTYAAASQAQQTLSIGGLTQTVSFTSTPPTLASVGGAGYSPTAASTAGLGVTIGLDPSSTGCALSSGVVSFTSVGTCVLDATQTGNSTYLPASLQQTIPVGKGASSITITSRAPKALAGGAYSPGASSSTGDTVLVSLGSHSTGCGMLHGAVEFRTVGSCIVDFTDPGNANYLSAVATQQFVITKGHVQLRTSVSPSKARAGATVSLSGTVSVPYATGVVTFSAGGKVLCSAAVHGGVATCHAAISLTKGAYKVTGSYSGSTSFFATTGASRVVLT
jgi:Inosine-uridine preferring nucleoside hydrolase